MGVIAHESAADAAMFGSGEGAWRGHPLSTATDVNLSTQGQAPITYGELRAWRGLLRAHACLAKRVGSELEREHHLPMTSYEVLNHLHEAPEGRMRMCDLAEQAQLSRSGLTRMVDRLERDGLLSPLLLRTRRPRRLRVSHRHRTRAPGGGARDPSGGRPPAVPVALQRGRAGPAGRHVGADRSLQRPSGRLTAAAAPRLTPRPCPRLREGSDACGSPGGFAGEAPAAVAPVPAEEAHERDDEGDQAPQPERFQHVAGGAARAGRRSCR